ncbi:site-2 protease family protein [Caminibacter pacificus]|uniref:Site-2 protease family protein n=1 Tax=Caminibacter pacificus TaxID=1424653 RepID=A0AAJ4RCL5_9BACT|nr:site-2 protease family protein [Caminibacter pacificus]NPA87656.1 site-2 protease family protein [Campylobacterota bacterium]QCI27930.1 site-2 protease family protein [Caminibacter pacificus]ROR39892.1 Zn-dependent protease [Caminibacter pacificus]
MDFVIKFSAMILAFLVAIIGHEIMHGLVAKYYGDETASREGRLSINPIKHIDPFGSIVFPIVLYLSQKLVGVENPIIFGWAKPVPVNIFTVVQNGGYLAAVAVSLAGVTYNFIMALIASSIIGFVYPPNNLIEAFLFMFLFYMVVVNVILAVFNLIPVPPLDGANAIKYLSLHFRWESIVRFYNKIEPYGMIILMIILFTPLSDYIFMPAKIIIAWLLS